MLRRRNKPPITYAWHISGNLRATYIAQLVKS
jgi:hypothetical protein